MIPEAVLRKCIEILSVKIDAITPLNVGDISQAILLETNNGRFFLKTNASEIAGEMFEAEAKGLGQLSNAGFATAEVLGLGTTDACGYLLLNYIEPSYRPVGFWEDFGGKMADLHRNAALLFGLNHNNFIGSLHQPNRQHQTWPNFYIHERLLPQLSIAQQQNKLQVADYQDFENIFKKIPSLCPSEPPALTHGDFWSGNFLCNSEGHPVLIDPAVSYAHREMDIAMSRLFGGFDRPFYIAYQAAWPLEPGFEQRMPIYQLYYLLVHVNLFGGGYVNQVRSILNQFK